MRGSVGAVPPVGFPCAGSAVYKGRHWLAHSHQKVPPSERALMKRSKYAIAAALTVLVIAGGWLKYRPAGPGADMVLACARFRHGIASGSTHAGAHGV